MAVDSGAFRAVFGAVPTPVAIITALDADGEPRGFTCNAFSAVSADPPQLLVCVDKRSQTLPAVLFSGAFGVNLLAHRGQDTARVFAGKAARKFDGVPWRPGLSGVPVLTEAAVAHAGCALVRSVPAGDHLILIGRVEETEVFRGPAALYQRGVFGMWEAEPELAAPRG
ncbi:flavin reductase family protein [Streptomyces sp. NPDC001595]|uniref:flavin reductase family protein n=1 Tax=Streptomyces sp. NPDC001532 TaxID=3154520 RepID=UPI0033315C66